MKARTVVGMGEKSLVGGPGPELHLRRENEEENRDDNRWLELKKTVQTYW